MYKVAIKEKCSSGDYTLKFSFECLEDAFKIVSSSIVGDLGCCFEYIISIEKESIEDVLD